MDIIKIAKESANSGGWVGPSEKQRKPKLGNVNSEFVQPTLPNCQCKTGFPSTFICVQPSHAITSSQAANRAPGSRGSIQYKMNQITVRCAGKANMGCRCILNCQIGRANIFRIAFCGLWIDCSLQACQFPDGYRGLPERWRG